MLLTNMFYWGFDSNKSSGFQSMIPRPAEPAISLNVEMQDLKSHLTCNASSECGSQKYVFYQSPPTDSDTD